MMRRVLHSGIQKLVTQAFGSQLRHNMSSGLIMAVITAAVLFVSYPLYLRFLGYEKYGVWLVLAVVLSFAYMGDLGITPAEAKLSRPIIKHKNGSVALTKPELLFIVISNRKTYGFSDSILAK